MCRGSNQYTRRYREEPEGPRAVTSVYAIAATRPPRSPSMHNLVLSAECWRRHAVAAHWTLAAPEKVALAVRRATRS